MILKDDYENAKSLVLRYEEQEKVGKAVKCTLENIELRRGIDGHWLSFRTLLGRETVICIENVFSANVTLDQNIRQWAYEQEVIEKDK